MEFIITTDNLLIDYYNALDEYKECRYSSSEYSLRRFIKSSIDCYYLGMAYLGIRFKLS